MQGLENKRKCKVERKPKKKNENQGDTSRRDDHNDISQTTKCRWPVEESLVMDHLMLLPRSWPLATANLLLVRDSTSLPGHYSCTLALLSHCSDTLALPSHCSDPWHSPVTVMTPWHSSVTVVTPWHSLVTVGVLWSFLFSEVIL